MSSLGCASALLAPVLEAVHDLSGESAAAYVRGAAAGYGVREREQTVEVVWSGPRTHAVPTRATPEVLKGLIDRAERELLLVTYSETAYEPVVAALTLASARGVEITIVVETLQGAGSALAGREPAAAFAPVPSVSLWHWPKEKREHPGGKMHARIAVAYRRELFTSSVNSRPPVWNAASRVGYWCEGDRLRSERPSICASCRPRGSCALWSQTREHLIGKPCREHVCYRYCE